MGGEDLTMRECLKDSDFVSSLWLRDSRRSVTSQDGEDGVLEAMFERIGTSNKCCCEFGALDGRSSSNTWNLIHNQGWRGILIEGDAERFKRLLAAAPLIGDVVPIQAYVQTDGPNSLDNLLSQARAPIDIDLLSIDIDNDDYWVWESLRNFRPRVVVIEVNSQWPAEAEKVPVPGYHRFTYHTGASIRTMVRLAKSKGYELAIHTGNGIFIRQDLAPQLQVDPERWMALFDSSWLNPPISVRIAERARDTIRILLGTHYSAVGSCVKRLRRQKIA